MGVVIDTGVFIRWERHGVLLTSPVGFPSHPEDVELKAKYDNKVRQAALIASWSISSTRPLFDRP